MKYLFLSLFIISSILHLYASFVKNKPMRNVTKGWLLLSLMAFYATAVPSPSWLVLLAILFSWLGDVLLIPKGTKWFAAGGVAFMISHVFFALAYASLTNFINVNVWLIIILALVDFAAVFVVFYFLKKRLPKALFYSMFFYLLCNGGMNCFAWFMFASLQTTGALITAIAALFFFISDCTLFFVRFDKNSENKSHFTIMLTYLIAEFFIIFGLIL